MKKRLNLKPTAWLITFLTIVLFSLSSLNVAAQTNSNLDLNNCTYKAIKLYGKVKKIDAFPDLKVKLVDAFPDLKVQEVTVFPDQCGKWQAVDSFPDFTIQLVTDFPDITIQYVDTFPGIP